MTSPSSQIPESPATSSNTPLLSLRNFSLLPYGQAAIPPLTLAIHPGELHLILGKIGSGKSLLTEAFAKIERPNVARSGQLSFSPGLQQISLRAQDPRLSVLATDRVSNVLFRGKGQTQAAFTEELQLIWDLDFQRIRRLRFRDLSGGERARALSAMAFNQASQLLLIDGFSELLDPQHREAMKLQIQRKLAEGTAVVVTSRRPLGRDLTPDQTHILGELVGTSAVPLISKKKDTPAKVLLEVDRLRVHLGNRGLLRRSPKAQVLQGASFYLRTSETLAVLGPSGAGKTALLQSIAGLHSSDSGRILFQERDMTHARGRKLQKYRSFVQLVFQESSAVLERDRRVADLLAEAASIAGEPRLKLSSQLERLGLDASCLDATAWQLSPGEAQLIDLCRRLILGPKLLMIDEPRVGGIDGDGGLLHGVLRAYTQRERSVLFATSDPTVARSADKIAFMYGGRILELGASHQLLKHPAHPATQAFLQGRKLPDLDPRYPRRGCSYTKECALCQLPRCEEKEPALAPHPYRKGSRQRVACFHPLP